MATPTLLQGLMSPQVVDAGGAIGQGLQNVQRLQQIGQNPMRNKLLQLQTQEQEAAVDVNEQVRNLQSMAIAANDATKFLSNNDIDGTLRYFDQRIEAGESQGRDMSDSRRARDAIIADMQSGVPTDQIAKKQLQEFESDKAVALDNINILTGGTKENPTPAALQTFDAMTAHLTPEQKQKAAEIQLGLQSRAGTVTGQERIAEDPELTTKVAKSQGEIAGSKAGESEKAKLQVQADLKPVIEKGVIKARGEGESEVRLDDMQASLPGLYDVVDNLKELGETASFRMSGRAYNAVARELGFSPTEGASTRAKYIATVNNEVLPLLRQTFGAAFTEKEGESLKATLGDVNMSPEEKNAQLDAFIEAKVRSIETEARRTGTDITLPNREQAKQMQEEVDPLGLFR